MAETYYKITLDEIKQIANALKNKDKEADSAAQHLQGFTQFYGSDNAADSSIPTIKEMVEKLQAHEEVGSGGTAVLDLRYLSDTSYSALISKVIVCKQSELPTISSEYKKNSIVIVIED